MNTSSSSLSVQPEGTQTVDLYENFGFAQQEPPALPAGLLWGLVIGVVLLVVTVFISTRKR